MKKIGLFGGTFDPPHIGHLIIAEEVLYKANLDEVWFIPTFQPPHKEDALSNSKDRLKMLQLSIDGTKQLAINDIEIKREGKSYTIETINELLRIYKNVQFYFIIGADMVESLQTWVKIDELMNKIVFIGVGRPGFELKTTYSIKEVSVPLIDISSSEIRRRILTGLPFEFMVRSEVYSYIKERQLYGYK